MPENNCDERLDSRQRAAPGSWRSPISADGGDGSRDRAMSRNGDEEQQSVPEVFQSTSTEQLIKNDNTKRIAEFEHARESLTVISTQGGKIHVTNDLQQERTNSSSASLRDLTSSSRKSLGADPPTTISQIGKFRSEFHFSTKLPAYKRCRVPLKIHDVPSDR